MAFIDLFRRRSSGGPEAVRARLEGAMADALDKVKGSLVQGYATRSGRTPEDIAALMSAETWFDAADALEAGLATRLVEPVRIAASFDIARFRNAPPGLIEAVTEAVEPCNGFDRDPDQQKGTSPAAEAESDVAQDNSTSCNTITPAETGTPTDTPSRPKGQGTGVVDGNIPPGPLVPASTVADANTASDASAIRAEAIAHACAVVDLCRLAGQPEMAGRFLAQEVSLDAVRSALLAAIADGLRRRQNDDRAARPPHPSLRHRRNPQRELASQNPRLSPAETPARVGCASWKATPPRASSRPARGVPFGRRSGGQIGCRLKCPQPALDADRLIAGVSPRRWRGRCGRG
jgi:ATP-dependent Clp protease protease subunit